MPRLPAIPSATPLVPGIAAFAQRFSGGAVQQPQPRPRRPRRDHRGWPRRRGAGLQAHLYQRNRLAATSSTVGRSHRSAAGGREHSWCRSKANARWSSQPRPTPRRHRRRGDAVVEVLPANALVRGRGPQGSNGTSHRKTSGSVPPLIPGWRLRTTTSPRRGAQQAASRISTLCGAVSESASGARGTGRSPHPPQPTVARQANEDQFWTVPVLNATQAGRPHRLGVVPHYPFLCPG